MNSFMQTLKNLGPVRLAALGGVGLATLLFLVAVILRMGGESMTTLYTGLSASDSGAVIQRLEQMNVAYQASADGSRISVPEAQVGRMKALLAQEGIPAGGGVGYEIFNQPEGFGTTSFLQNINQQRALEGELARTIRAMQGIGNARVQLVLPRRELFARDGQQSRASVFIETRSNFSRDQVVSIQHLIASAVPQLDPGRVAVIDSRGNLLAAGTGSDNVSAQQASAEEQKIAIEQRLSQRVEEILGRAVGYDKVRAEVTVELDMDSITTQSESYDPESQVARSTQSVSEQNQTNEVSPGGDANSPVSVQSNLPGGNATAGNNAAQPTTIPTNKSSRTEETTNFEISKTTQSQTRMPGAIKRVSVSVLVDGTYKTEGEGAEAKQVYQARTQQEIEQYAALVRNAVGFDADRGDAVEVANLQFAEQASADKGSVVDQLTNNPQIMQLAEKLGMLLLAILVLMVVVRPMVRQLLEVKAGESESSGTPALSGPSTGAITQQIEEAEQALEEGQDNMIDINRVDGRVKASSLKKMSEIIDKHPEEAVAIIRQWIYAES